VSFRDLIMDIQRDEKIAKTHGNLARLAVILEQHPLPAKDVATILTVAAGTAVKQKNPAVCLVLVTLVRSCIDRHPSIEEIDKLLNELI
jgi:hypothetical protein